jgi:envelope integrity protein B
MSTRTRLLMACAAALPAVLLAVATPGPAAPAGVVLVPHRAIYDLRLLRTRGRGDIESVRGRIVYDFSGSACSGYALNFRQVSEMNSTEENKSVLSDLRSTTWEEGGAKRFHFSSQNYVNDNNVDSVEGDAERDADHVGIKLAKPTDKSFDLDRAMVFPAEQMRRIIEAARAGKTMLQLPVYDGSDNGEKVYSTLTLIGREIPPDKAPDDAAAHQAALAGLKRWPVTISYFDRNDAKGGEQTPTYAISFELYENGISRALELDYDDFVVAGTMSRLDIKQAPECK